MLLFFDLSVHALVSHVEYIHPAGQKEHSKRSSCKDLQQFQTNTICILEVNLSTMSLEDSFEIGEHSITLLHFWPGLVKV